MPSRSHLHVLHKPGELRFQLRHFRVGLTRPFLLPLVVAALLALIVRARVARRRWRRPSTHGELTEVMGVPVASPDTRVGLGTLRQGPRGPCRDGPVVRVQVQVRVVEHAKDGVHLPAAGHELHADHWPRRAEQGQRARISSTQDPLGLDVHLLEGLAPQGQERHEEVDRDGLLPQHLRMHHQTRRSLV